MQGIGFVYHPSPLHHCETRVLWKAWEWGLLLRVGYKRRQSLAWPWSSNLDPVLCLGVKSGSMLSIANSWARLLSTRGVRSASFKTLKTSCTEDTLVIQQMGYEKGENATLSLQHCSVVKLLSLQVWRAGDWRGHHGLLNSSLAAKENQRTTEGGGKRCWKQWMLVFTTRSKISCMLLEDSQDSSYLLSWELSNWTCFHPKEFFVISPKLLNRSRKRTTIEIT